MTLKMTCDICGDSAEVRIEASCSADHQSSEPQPMPDIEIVSLRGGPIKWTPKFVNGKNGHECSACVTHRKQNLDPEVERIKKRHRDTEAQELADAVAEWEASRKPNEQAARYT